MASASKLAPVIGYELRVGEAMHYYPLRDQPRLVRHEGYAHDSVSLLMTPGALPSAALSRVQHGTTIELRAHRQAIETTMRAKDGQVIEVSVHPAFGVDRTAESRPVSCELEVARRRLDAMAVRAAESAARKRVNFARPLPAIAKRKKRIYHQTTIEDVAGKYMHRRGGSEAE